MPIKTPHILVPMGFSEQSFLALDQALVFAKAMEAKVLLLAVNNNDHHLWELMGDVTNQFELGAKVHSKLAEVAKEYSAKSDIPIEPLQVTGVVYEEIARISEERKVDLIIMGTNGKPQNLKKRFIGSNAFRTVTLAECPVITIKGVRNINSIETIIFPFVLDRRSKEKVGTALHYARLFNAKIKIVSILEDKEMEHVVSSHLKQVETFITDHEVLCTSELIEPAADIKGVVDNTLAYAYANQGDLLIITEDNSEGSSIADFFISSDVQSMIYHSEIPVMCIAPSNVKWSSMW